MRLTYVTRTFPRLSESFVLREVAEFQARGADVDVWALVGRDAGEPEATGALVDAVAPLVRRVPPGPRPLLGALAWAARRRPRALAGAALWSARWALHDRDPRQLAALAYGAYVARGLRPETQLHAHFANTPATVALLAARLGGTTCSFTGHARDLFAATSPAFLAEKIRRATLVVCGTEDAAVRIRAIAGPSESGKVVVIRNGVTAPAAPYPPPSGATPTVLCVARLVPKKGIDALLRALAALRADGAAVQAEIIGEGPEREALEALAAELGLREAVAFLGARSRAEVDAALARAVVFALPCRPMADGDADGLPLAIVEALAGGVPVISTRVAGIPEAVVDGRSGLLVEPDDVPGLTVALARVLGDAELRAHLSAGGRALAIAEHDLATNVGRLADHLASGLARGQRG